MIPTTASVKQQKIRPGRYHLVVDYYDDEMSTVIESKLFVIGKRKNQWDLLQKKDGKHQCIGFFKRKRDAIQYVFDVHTIMIKKS